MCGKKVIVVKPQCEPNEAVLGRSLEDAKQLMGTTDLELAPYPQPARPFLLMLDGMGMLKPTPYNRWGIVGTFLVLRRSSVDGKELSLTERQITEILRDLKSTDGYLEEECPVRTPLKEPFKQHGVPPAGWVPPAGKWFRD